MNTLSTFDFNNNTLRSVEIDGEPWFVASDVCKTLGLTNITKAISNCTSSSVRNHRLSPTGRARPNKVVSESGLYDLIIQSRKPEAREFKTWITGTVLPAIRKDGGYIMGEEKVATGEMSEDELVLKAINVMQKKIERLTTENASMNKELSTVTIAEYTALNHVYFSQSEKNRLAAKARSLAEYLGMKITKSPRVIRAYGKTHNTEVNVYPRDLLDRVAGDLGLFEAAQGEMRPVH